MFKPGDVAVIPFARGPVLAMMTVQGWSLADHGETSALLTEARPLVVVDPEDYEQVARLTGALAVHGANPNDRNYSAETQAALRSLIEPPKLEEPTGLGAVVEDVEGRKYVRAGVTPLAWTHAVDPDCNDWCGYEEIAVVRVLSEGVQ